ncbi:MAG TPA: ATP-binding protein, partial [Gammaproteobacteria bacterium]
MLDAPQLNAQALATLNLDTQPFLPPERCKDYFVNTALGMLINGVYQQLSNHEGIQVIKGEPGIGKTSFCHRLLCDVPEGLAIDLHKAKSGHTINALLQTLAGASEPDNKSGTQELAVKAANRIFRHLFDRLQPVLLIDDAHLLTAKTLHTLLKFLTAVARQNYGRLKLILVGERKIDETLAKIDPSLLKPDDIFSTLLRPLARQDIEDYIRFRLEHAGANRAMPLTPKELAVIQSGCGGLPGKVNRLTCEALNGHNGNSSPKKPFSRLFLSLVLPAAILAPLVFWLTANRTADSPAPSTHPSSVTNSKLAIMETENRNPAVTDVDSSGPVKIEPAVLDTSNSDPDNGTEHSVTSDTLAVTEPQPPSVQTTPGNIIDSVSSEAWLAAQPGAY